MNAAKPLGPFQLLIAYNPRIRCDAQPDLYCQASQLCCSRCRQAFGHMTCMSDCPCVPDGAMTPLTLVQVYALTDSAASEDYKQLQHLLDQTPNASMLCLTGGFNTKMGSQAEQWGSAIGRMGPPAPITHNGMQLLSLCFSMVSLAQQTVHRLSMSDTMLKHKAAHL